jgi:hypothetical protein
LKIVFAHFGKHIPKHLYLNIERCLKLFPNIKVVLIVNRDCKMPKIRDLEISFYDPTSEWRRLEGNLSHPKDFRDNFWLTSLARFLALENYLDINPGDILHVESDVILAADFPFEKFITLAKPIAFPILSRSQGIASILYIRNHKTATTLVSLTMEMSAEDSQTTDMLILRRFYDLHPDITQAIPIGPSDHGVYRKNEDNILFSDMKHAVSIFGGCFDGLDIGYFLYGVDPRNDKGRKHIRRSLPNNYLLVPSMKISYSEERDFIDLGSEDFGRMIPLYSLHIHSKNSKLIRISRKSKELRQGTYEYLLPEKYKLVPLIFMQAVRSALGRRLGVVFQLKRSMSR